MMLLVPRDSPLRNPPAFMSPDQKSACDAVRFALDMTYLSYVRLVDNLHSIGEVSRTNTEIGASVTLAITDAWAVIDNVHRLTKVIRRFPHLKKAQSLEVHLRAFGAVEPLRHGIQHIERNSRSCPRTQFLARWVGSGRQMNPWSQGTRSL